MNKRHLCQEINSVSLGEEKGRGRDFLLQPDADSRHVARPRYRQGMTNYLYARQIRIFDYPSRAQPLPETLRQNAERQGAENGLETGTGCNEK